MENDKLNENEGLETTPFPIAGITRTSGKSGSSRIVGFLLLDILGGSGRCFSQISDEAFAESERMERYAAKSSERDSTFLMREKENEQSLISYYNEYNTPINDYSLLSLMKIVRENRPATLAFDVQIKMIEMQFMSIIYHLEMAKNGESCIASLNNHVIKSDMLLKDLAIIADNEFTWFSPLFLKYHTARNRDYINQIIERIRMECFIGSVYYSQMMGDIYMECANYLTEMSSFDKAIELSDKARESYRAINNIHGIRRTHQTKGVSLMRQGKLDQAEKEFLAVVLP